MAQCDQQPEVCSTSPSAPVSSPSPTTMATTTAGTSTTASTPSTTTTTTSSNDNSKKRFNLREAQAEVKSLMDGGVASWEERGMGMHRHYQTLVREYKRTEKKLVECQKKQLEVSQHRDVIQTEYARVNVAKGKLENLCRELQKHSKAVAEESKQRQREDEERRKEVSAKFQSTINDITLKMQEHHQRNQALRQENLELIAKLKQITEQYEAREEHYEKLLKHKQLELQLCEAKMAQQMVSAAEEKENSLAERQYLLAETLEQQKKCEMLTQQETELRSQLSMYSDKFEEFQQTLTRSNQVFATFKKDTDRMSKTIGALEKEVGLWKARYEKASITLMDVSEERSSLEGSVKTLKSKTDKLERLCRAMQTERTSLREEVKTLKEGAQNNVNKDATPSNKQETTPTRGAAETTAPSNTPEATMPLGDGSEGGDPAKQGGSEQEVRVESLRGGGEAGQGVSGDGDPLDQKMGGNGDGGLGGARRDVVGEEGGGGGGEGDTVDGGGHKVAEQDTNS